MSAEAVKKSVEYPYVDPDTGEICEERTADLVVADLPRVGEQINSVDREIAEIDQYMRERVDEIIAKCSARVTTLRKTRMWLLAKAETFFAEVGKDRISYPDIGVFRVAKARARVDDSNYLNFDEDVKAKIWSQHSDLFRRVEKVTPDKKAIKQAIEDGGEVPGFHLAGGHSHFLFKPEK